MPAHRARPPIPGPFVQPNFLPVMEALGDITFPISKRELIDQVGDGTVVFGGRNIDLHQLIKDVHDDYFDTEDELRGALEAQYPRSDDASDVDSEQMEAGALPTGPQDSWQTRVGPGDTASPASYVEPPE